MTNLITANEARRMVNSEFAKSEWEKEIPRVNSVIKDAIKEFKTSAHVFEFDKIEIGRSSKVDYTYLIYYYCDQLTKAGYRVVENSSDERFVSIDIHW